MVIKLNYPSSWNNTDNGLASNFSQQMPGGSNKWGNYQFHINDDIDICDYWVVYGDLDQKTTVTSVYGSIFILSELTGNKQWDLRFLSQFDLVLGCQDHIEHANYITTQYVCPWQIKKSYDELVRLLPPTKLSNLSAVISDMTWKQGHKKRFAFVNQLKGHFKDNLNWFGRGNTFVNDKSEGIEPFRYSIAIENTQTENYWTEKIMDCFLCYTMPIYSGCTNIGDFFPKGSYISLDMTNLSKSITIIENAIETDLYSKNLPLIIEARNRVLNEFQFFPKVCTIISKLERKLPKSKKTVLNPESFYTKESNWKRAGRILRTLVSAKNEQ